MRNKKDIAINVTKTGARGLRGIIAMILKIIGTIFLIGITTGFIFSCIFLIYIKTNLSTGLDVRFEDFTINQTSIIYCIDSDTGNYVELCELQGTENRIWVDYKDIPEDMEHAAVAIEDKRFYNHHGVDWSRTTSAFFHMFLSNSNTYGGSTLTQQLIKNLTGYDDVTVQRKLEEIFRALEVEKDYSKEEIVEWYLNVVYFGHRNYGIGSAAEYYFGKEVSKLSLAECASIIGITNNPSMYSPYMDKEANKSRQETILYEMFDQGYITEQEYNSAVAEELHFIDHSGSSSSGSSYSWFVDALIEDVIHDLMVTKDCSYDIAEKLLFTGGYQIYSTMDTRIQAIVDSVYEDPSHFTARNGSVLQSAIVIMDPYTGNIVALSGGVGEKTVDRAFNRATDATRPPGSSIKPIAVYGPAMEYGLISPDTKFEDSKDVTLTGTSWMPKNSGGGYSGIVTIRTAVVRSLNTVAAQVMDKLTPTASFQFMTEKLHFTTLTESDCDYAPLALGQLTNGATVREMTTAYGIFINSGLYTSSRLYTEILDADGNLVYKNEPEVNPAISEAVAYQMTTILHTAATSGTGYESSLPNMPNAGKTGTTSDDCDRWFSGFTPYYTAAVWTGYDSPSTIRWSGNPAAQIWKLIMTQVHEPLEYKDFPTPSNTYVKSVPGVTELPYSIRYVTEEGVVLKEETGTSVSGREIEAEALEFDGYTLVSGGAKQTMVLEKDKENVITFVYRANVPEPDPNEGDPPEPGPEEGGPPDPEAGGTTPDPQPET